MMIISIESHKYLDDNYKRIMGDMIEYRRLTGIGWDPFNEDDARMAGYNGAEEWHNALIQAVEEAKRA